MNKFAYALPLVFCLTAPASADALLYCHDGICVQQNVNPLGSYDNPIEDHIGGDLSGPVHRGMYCELGQWHHGWLRAWEVSPVVKPTCGSAVYQMPH